MGVLSSFVHLRNHSTYSLLEGALSPKQLAELSVKNRMPAVAITDSNNLFGSLEFSLTCKDAGIQPIIGCIVNVRIDSKNSGFDHLLLYAQNKTGYEHLLDIVSHSFLYSEDGGQPVILLDYIRKRSDGLLALTGGPKGPVDRLLAAGDQSGAKKLLVDLAHIFTGRLYVELQRHNEPSSIESDLITLAYDLNIPLVATNDTYFHEPLMHQAHDALLCIASGRYVTEEDRRKVSKECYFKTEREMRTLFSDLPEAIENTLVIAKRCAICSPTSKPLLPRFPCEGGRNEAEELRYLSHEGLKERLRDYVFDASMDDEQKAALTKEYQVRLDYELEVIISMEFPGYFLIVSDFISFCVKEGIPVGPGRGSGAGSVVAWSLKITGLDPIRFGLLFERFLNPERVSMPDFDIDFCQERRDEVIDYVQDKYGHDQVAQIITFGKLQARAVLRDVGRVLQIPYNQVDRICKLVPNNPANPTTLSEALKIEPELKKVKQEDESIAQMIEISLKLEGLNRHCSTHAAGVVIGDRPLVSMVPLYRDPRSTVPVVQYSMKYAELSGLVKFDFLGLKTLTVIAKTVTLLQAKGINLDIEHIPLDDKKTFELLSKGDSIGVFQLESAGMRDTLKKLQPDKIEDVIALISLYRPGPMDNIPTYIARKHGNETPDYLHPMLAEVLNETFGVIIYQEQVMEIAQILSGYTLGGADILRRAMGKKIKAEMDKEREKFVEGAKANNVDVNKANAIFDLVAKFAGYGFNKSHAAGYSMISYQTAYLKANYPVEFLTASLNLDIHDTDKVGVFCREAKHFGITILPPDINASKAYFTVEKFDEKDAIRFGVGALKGVGIAATEQLGDIRAKGGEFASIFDAASRLGPKCFNKRTIEGLVKSGAFDGLNSNRKQLFNAADMLSRYSSVEEKDRASPQQSLFGDAVEVIATPTLSDVGDWSRDEMLQCEYEAFGFYLSSHPLDPYVAMLTKGSVIMAANFETQITKSKRIKVVGVITAKRVRISAKGKFAHLTLSDPTGSFEVGIFNSDLLADAHDIIEVGSSLLVSCDARRDEGGIRLNVVEFEPLEEFVSNYSSTLYCECDELTHIEHLSELLSSEVEGKMEVLLALVLDQKKVTITLPKRYRISTELVEKIRVLPGMLRVEEG